jgi:hypothetical protein
MGISFTDKFSLLHVANGIVAYFWGIPILVWFILNVLYECVENSSLGMTIINKIKIWPGGKPKADTLVNSIGDQFYCLLGWMAAWCIGQL